MQRTLPPKVKPANVVELSDEVVQSMKMGQVFQGSEGSICSIDFHKSGDFCVSASKDGVINYMQASEGRLLKQVYSKKYGCGVTRFTHHSESILYSSRNDRGDFAVRYHSLYNNNYLAFFEGHTDRVVDLAMSPADDIFLTASMDMTVRLWDLKSNACQAMLKTNGRPCVAFDPTGLVFAVGTSDGAVRLFDARKAGDGPFDMFRMNMSAIRPRLLSVSPELASMPPSLQFEPLSLRFSGSGESILVSTDRAIVLQLDAYSGELTRAFSGHRNEHGLNLEASYSPDARYVLSGSSDGRLHVWSASSGKEVATWEGHTGPVVAARWNPVTAMVASGCTNVAFWIPSSP